jgi:hypothetical protein
MEEFCRARVAGGGAGTSARAGRYLRRRHCRRVTEGSMPINRPSRPYDRHYDLSAAWGFAIAAAVIVIIMVGWGWTGHGRGWGRNNQLAHMMPVAVSSSNGPATRSNSASANWH